MKEKLPLVYHYFRFEAGPGAIITLTTNRLSFYNYKSATASPRFYLSIELLSPKCTFFTSAGLWSKSCLGAVRMA